MNETEIIHRLSELGFKIVGKPGRNSRFTRHRTGETFTLPRSERMHRAEFFGQGSVYVHKPGVIVATGEYQEWLSRLRDPNGVVGPRDRPGWYDSPGEPAVTELLEAIESLGK